MNDNSQPEEVQGQSVDAWLKTLEQDGLDAEASARVAAKLKLGAQRRRRPSKMLIVAGFVVAGATAAAAAASAISASRSATGI